MDILVYADWKGLKGSTLMGTPSVTHTRGHAVFTFSYDKQWIKSGQAEMQARPTSTWQNSSCEMVFHRLQILKSFGKESYFILRNHGFLLTPDGWKLSPAYDINPVHFGSGLTLNISETDNSLDWDLARSTAKYFRVPDKQAMEIISGTREVVRQWPKIASKYKIKRAEQELMARAFEHSQ